jgi:hypothetical protein
MLSLIRRFTFIKIFVSVLLGIVFFDSYNFKVQASTLTMCTNPANAAACSAITGTAVAGAGQGARTATVVNTGLGLSGLGTGLGYYYDQNRGKFGWGGLSENKAKQIQNDVINSPFIQNFPEGSSPTALYTISLTIKVQYQSGTVVQPITVGGSAGQIKGPIATEIINNGSAGFKLQLTSGVVLWSAHPSHVGTITILTRTVTRVDGASKNRDKWEGATLEEKKAAAGGYINANPGVADPDVGEEEITMPLPPVINFPGGDTVIVPFPGVPIPNPSPDPEPTPSPSPRVRPLVDKRWYNQVSTGNPY